MSDVTSFSEHITIALNTVEELEKLLYREYDALGQQELNEYQDLQPTKTELLHRLEEFDHSKTQFVDELHLEHPPKDLTMHLKGEEDKSNWTRFIKALSRCDRQHRKIDAYLRQKIQATNEILEILRISNNDNSSTLYDSLGRKSVKTIGNIIDEA